MEIQVTPIINIDAVQFYVSGTEDIRKDATVQVNNPELTKKGKPSIGGPNDPHMGTTDMGWDCRTCGNSKIARYGRKKCPGHYGEIILRYPIKNPVFRDQTLKWLKIICFNCGRIIINTHIKNTTKYGKLSLLAKLAKGSTDLKRCIHCNAPHPTITKSKPEPTVFLIENPSTKKQTELLNHEIAKILDRVTLDTVKEAGKSEMAHPRFGILRSLRVPPTTIRPDVFNVGGNRSSHSDITALLKNIVEKNNRLPMMIPDRNKITKPMLDDYKSIDTMYYMMVKGVSTTSQVRMTTSSGKQFASIADRIPKKTGRMRQNIMAKRSWFTARTVIIGDNYIHVDELGIPVSFAKKLTVPEIVREDNMDRLMIYYANKDVYPGCTSIKKRNGIMYEVSNINEKYRPQIGDTIYRHMMDGDLVMFNRAPSLEDSSVSSMYVRILPTKVIRMNPSACNWFNADFDGDCMHIFAPQNIMSRIELRYMSHCSRNNISFRNSIPYVGGHQDAIMGSAELTRGIQIIDKWHAMNLFANIYGDLSFKKSSYTNRELMSKMLPRFNMERSPSFYMAPYAGIIKYKPTDIKVIIRNGTLVQGVMDGNIVSQGKAGSIFHIINNMYGPAKALQSIYDLHQITSRYFIWKGFTCGMRDLTISDQARVVIKKVVDSMYAKCESITRQLVEGKLTPPLGTSMHSYYEELIANALATSDELVVPVLKSIDFDNNNIVKLILSGSKGKIPNLASINAVIGQVAIRDMRPTQHFAYGRTSPYFCRFDMSPEAFGYIPTSFTEGIQPNVYSFSAGEARYNIITNALSTATTGYQNRLGVKCLESIVINNCRSAAKPYALVQPLYGEYGIDARRTEVVKFPSLLVSNTEFDSIYKAKPSDFKGLSTKAVAKALDEEYEQIKQDRKIFRDAYTRIDIDTIGTSGNLKDKYDMPFNIHRIIDDVRFKGEGARSTVKALQRHRERKNATLPRQVLDGLLDPVRCVAQVKQLCEELPYLYFNNAWYKNRKKIPAHIEAATFMAKTLIRSCLSTKRLAKMGINNIQLSIIIDTIKATFSRALIQYGCAIGIIAAQCVCAPLTQYMLDSKHRAGVTGGRKTGVIERVKEILSARPTEKMKNPTMTLVPKEEYWEDEKVVRRIANHIEMMVFERFILVTQIFFEDYGNPVHPDYKHEVKMIKQYEDDSMLKPPSDLSKWCIRFELDKREMLINHMDLESFVNAIIRQYPDIHIVYTPELSKQIVLRCYLRSEMIKIGSKKEEMVVIDIMRELRNCLLRGIRGVQHAAVLKVMLPNEQKDGSIKNKAYYVIETFGSNLEDALCDPYIDPLRSQCDSVLEYESIFGINAARNKIIIELIKSLPKLMRKDLSVYADEMTFTGSVTNIQNSGMRKRDIVNVPLRMSFQSSLDVLEHASVNAIKSPITGISGPLTVGENVRIGTCYNSILVNDKMIAEERENAVDELMDDL